jgi:cytochrome P450
MTSTPGTTTIVAPRAVQPPTGPRGLPLVGPLFSFARDPAAFVTEVARQHGDIARFTILGTPTFLLSHPDHVQHVLVELHGDEMKDQITRGLVRILGQGLLTSEGTVWKRQRKLAAPSFSRADVAVYARAMVERAAAMADAITAPVVRDVHDDMTDVTLDVVVRTLFAREVPTDDIGPTVGRTLASYRSAYIGAQRMLPEWVPTRSRRTFKRGVRRIDEVLAAVIRDARASEQRGSDLLSRLLAATDADGSGMSDRQLRDEIITMFLAGHETTAIALTSALYLMARHPDLAARARTEIDEVLGDRLAVAEDLPRLKFLDAVVRETMRIYPPAWIVGREPLREVEVGGVRIPAGAQILMSQWVVHRDARWFPEPEVFRPDRWLDGSTTGLHRYAYFPFGGGPRVCIGNHFAMLEAVLILATLLQRLEVTTIPDTRFVLSPAVTLRPTGPVALKLTPRA